MTNKGIAGKEAWVTDEQQKRRHCEEALADEAIQ
jgi:hypothetical protein